MTKLRDGDRRLWNLRSVPGSFCARAMIVRQFFRANFCGCLSTFVAPRLAAMEVSVGEGGAFLLAVMA